MAYMPPNAGFFDGFRTPPFPTLYPRDKTAVTEDVLYVGWNTAFLVGFLSFLFILPAVAKGCKERCVVFFRVTIMLVLGLIIMLCNYGQEWEVGALDTHTAYRVGTGDEIKATIGVKLGLRSVNVTLKALEEPTGDLAGEMINYNERFTWTWAQGRAGFGPFAGQIQRDFRAAQAKGSPLPILWVAEYFTFDGEGLRFGRNYRTAGWFAHICIWLAFPLWILIVILSKLRIDYFAKTLTLLGSMKLMASLIWAFRRNFIELSIPFEDGVLVTKFGVHWYLSLIVGVICMGLGIGIYGLNKYYPDQLCEFFGNNPLGIIEQETTLGDPEPTTPSDNMEMGDVNRPARPVTILRSRGTTRRNDKKVNYPAYAARPTMGYLASNYPQQGLTPAAALSQTHGYNYDQQQQGYQPGYDQQDSQYPAGYDHQGYQPDQPAYNNQTYQQGYNDQGYQGDYNQSYQQEDYQNQDYQDQAYGAHGVLAEAEEGQDFYDDIVPLHSSRRQ